MPAKGSGAGKCWTVDVEMHHPPTCPDGPNWPQARFLVHGLDDLLWTDDIDAAVAYIREELTRVKNGDIHAR